MPDVQHVSVASNHRNCEKNNEESSNLNATLIREITGRLAGRIGNHRYDMWFRDASFVIDQNRLAVSTSNSFIAKWIESNFADDIRGVASDALGADTQVRIEVRKAALASDAVSSASRRHGDDSTADARSRNGRASRDDASIAHAQRDGSSFRPPKFLGRKSAPRLRRFADFVVSDTNRVAYGAAKQIAEAKNGSHHSPLFVHGPCGVGKTHLLQAACRHYAEVFGAASSEVRYVTAEQFTNEYIAAICKGRIDEFRRRMRRLELLAIDDVHFLSSKERTQIEFLHTYDEISMSGARVFIASDSHPRQLRRLNKALVNRMLSGMIVQIELPDLDLRRRLASKLAAERGLNVTEQALEAIASECTGSIRELEGAINKLLALRTSIQHLGGPKGTLNGNGSAGGSNEPIGLLLVQQLFGDHTHSANTPIRVATIMEVVCERLNVTRSDLMGDGRHKRVVLARSLIAYLSKKMTTHSFPEIACELGKRNHSTVHNANRRMCEQIEAGARVDLGGDSLPLPELVNQLRQQIVRRHRD